jgi:hypothetical protein
MMIIAHAVRSGIATPLAPGIVRKVSSQDIAQWRAEFEAAARRPLKTRWRYAFIHTYKPVLDDARFRAFDTMADYRAWCERELPRWLGYGQDI